MTSINHDISSNCGYISSGGIFYSCEYRGHYDILPFLYESERNLIKITFFDQKSLILIPVENITDAQIATLRLWCEKHQHSFPEEDVKLSKEA